MQVIARHEEPLVVQVGGRLVEGWVMDPPCAHCGGARLYFLAFDATCCPECNRWLDLLCPDPDCLHCRIRPERPWPETGFGQGVSASDGP